MYEVEQTFHFEAGHVLTRHLGRCQNPHGHSYVLTVKLRQMQLQSSGPQTNMVLDFGNLEKIVLPMIEQHLDHKWLNDSLSTESPTVEFIAKWVFDYLEPRLPGLLYAITMQETHDCKVTYTKVHGE